MNDTKTTLRVCEFVQTLRHTGDFFGKPFVLLPWQTEVLNAVYGTLNEKGKRQYKTAYLEIPKKNGKTELVAALSLYHLICDPPGGQIYCAAAERNQAALVYNAAADMISQSKALSKWLKVKQSTKEIINTKTRSFVKVLSAEAYSKHGLNPSVVIVDELHAHKKRDLYDTLTFGSGAAREEQLVWIITTAGDDPDRKSVGWEVHEKARRVLDGEVEDPSFFARIYNVPDECDIFDEENWAKANPSLGVTISLENVRREAMAARNSEAAEKLFRWLRLNQWVAIKALGWLPLPLWDQTEKGWTRADMLKRKCYLGIDLSTTTDLTAMCCLFPPVEEDEPWKFFVDAWIPEENMKERERSDGVPFQKWVKNGYIRATPGDCVDYSYLAHYIEDASKDFEVAYYCGDPWHLEMLRQLLPEQEQNRFVHVAQTMAGMSSAMHELERMFREKTIEHAVNPCGRWAFGNVAVATDGNENMKPMKNKSRDRIDPICALINAMAVAIQLESRKSVYETRGLRVI